MRQGQTENDDEYLTRLTTIFQNVEMSGGEHIMCSPLLLDKNLTGATLVEITIEAESFKAIFFIQQADEKQYG